MNEFWPTQSKEAGKILKAYDLISHEIGTMTSNKKVDTGKFTYTYANLDIMIHTLKPICEKHACRLRQFKCPISDRAVAMHTRLEHIESGEFIQDIAVVMIYENPQETSKACTTAQRYGIDNLFMLVYEDNPNDNDSNDKSAVITKAEPKKEYVARVGKSLSPKQQEMIDKALREIPANRIDKFKTHLWTKFETPNGVVTEEKLMPIVNYIQQTARDLKGEK